MRYLEKPYYVVPRDAIGQEAFAVIRDAMSRENVAGLARVVLSSRERPILVAPMGHGLCGVTLRFSHEVRGEEEYFSRIPEMKLPAEMVKLAQHIIETKSADFDPAMLEDHYRNALVRILRKKQAKVPVPRRALARQRHQPHGRVKAQHCGRASGQKALGGVQGRKREATQPAPAPGLRARHAAFSCRACKCRGKRPGGGDSSRAEHNHDAWLLLVGRQTV